MHGYAGSDRMSGLIRQGKRVRDRYAGLGKVRQEGLGRTKQAVIGRRGSEGLGRQSYSGYAGRTRTR
jgi:hypothetical protein